MNHNLIFFLGIFAFYGPINCVKLPNHRVELVQVIFRHGDRTPMKGEVFQDDRNDGIFESIGHGRLTEIGMQRELKIGQLLRFEYDEIPGTYDPRDVYAYSTGMERTIESLHMALEGLFPLQGTIGKNRRPFATYSAKFGNDFLSVFTCSRFENQWNQTRESEDFRRRKNLQKFDSLINELRINANCNFNTAFGPFAIYNNIKAAKSLGLKLPTWVTSEKFNALSELVRIYFESMVDNDSMVRKMVGPTIEVLLNNIEKNERNQAHEILHLYAAHDFNIASFSIAHNFTGIPIVPDFGSALIVEKLKSRDGKIHIRMRLWTGADERLIDLYVKGCGFICPLDDYKKIVANMLPREEDRDCLNNRVKRNSGKLRAIPRNEPEWYPIDNDARLSFALLGKDLLSLKYGKELLRRRN